MVIYGISLLHGDCRYQLDTTDRISDTRLTAVTPVTITAPILYADLRDRHGR